MKIPFSKEQILDRMRFENPWWENSKIEDYYASMMRRDYYSLLFPLIWEKAVKRAVVLMGPRRVGKTVLLFHTIQGLIDKGIPPNRICYISVETPIYNGVSLDELLQYYLEISNNKKNTDLFIFFDEVQYLKTLVDSYHTMKFIASGSAAAALKLKSAESGAGRFTEFILPPLTFQEYLSLKKIDNIIKEETKVDEKNGSFYESYIYNTDNIKKLNEYFVDYINFGGYPEVSLSETIQADPSRYIRNDIIDKVLLRDLPLLYGIEDIQELNSLFTYIAYNTGNEMSLDPISTSSGVSKNTIKKYIGYLEAAFLITVVNRIDNTGKIFKRANFFKVYLTNPSLRCALFSPLKEDDPFMGNLVETAIYSQWHHSGEPMYYARWNSGEIDIVYLNPKQKPQWAVEIKWSNKCVSDYKELKNLKHFCPLHKLKVAKVTTYDISEEKNIDGILFDFSPSSLYCYTVGRNLVRYRQPMKTIPIEGRQIGLFDDHKNRDSEYC